MKTLYLMLGRAGDILNILPLCWRDYTASGERSLVMVNEKFAPLMDGVGYADAIPVTEKFEDILGVWPKAEAAAKDHRARLVCTQIYGDNLATAETCSSFMRESWAQVPGAPAWGTLPLIFDKRDRKREAAVTRNLLQNTAGKPYVVCCTSGTSSPFGGNRELMLALRKALGKEFAFVDVSAFIAHRFFDLLGVMECAHCILSVDSGLLHLAHACPKVPVVAFITRTPSPWHGSPWRPSHVARFFYDEMPERTGDVIEAVKTARNGSQ
jgi:hypothetical protein